MNRSLALIVFLLFILLKVSGQQGKCPKIPEVYKWESAADYSKDFDLVKKTLKWLCNTPLGIDVQQRSQANAFVMEWIAGSPNIRVELDTKKIIFYDSHPDLLFSFIHGIALMQMEKKPTTEELAIYTKGYETVAILASQSEELSRSPDLKPLLKALRKNKLNEYTASSLGANNKK
jgi:hypothetical protein